MVFVPARRKAEKTQKESGKSRVNFRVIAEWKSLPSFSAERAEKAGVIRHGRKNSMLNKA